MEQQIGSNVIAKIEGESLTLVIDLSQNIGASKSGKSTLVASTNGNAVLPNGMRLGVNVYRPAR